MLRVNLYVLTKQVEILCKSDKNDLVNVDEKFRDELLKRIERIKQGERDLYF